jgi:hypothetical protein
LQTRKYARPRNIFARGRFGYKSSSVIVHETTTYNFQAAPRESMFLAK